MFEKLFWFKDWKIKIKFDQSFMWNDQIQKLLPRWLFKCTIAIDELQVRNKVVELGGWE